MTNDEIITGADFIAGKLEQSIVANPGKGGQFPVQEQVAAMRFTVRLLANMFCNLNDIAGVMTQRLDRQFPG